MTLQYAIALMTRKAMGNIADVCAAKLPSAYRILTLLFPLRSCRSRMQKKSLSKYDYTLYREQQLWSGNESVEIRYVHGSFVAGTSAVLPGVPCHIYINCDV